MSWQRRAASKAFRYGIHNRGLYTSPTNWKLRLVLLTILFLLALFFTFVKKG